MYVVEGGRVPIKIWSDEPVEGGALEQARHLADLPFAYQWIALMPDTHQGYGMPIGGVLAADGFVVPNAVGLDIGCGVRAWRTNLTAEEFLPLRQRVLNDIQRNVPTGREWHRQPQTHAVLQHMPNVPALHEQRDRAAMQLGSLGGGNHFYEVQRDDDGRVWVMVHSGSRNVGKLMAEHYDRFARAYNDRQPAERHVPPQWDLAPLPVDSGEGREYLTVMNWCLDFAYANRELMAECAHNALHRVFPNYEPEPFVDVHHNYARLETHFGREVMVHRKGAVRAVGAVIVPGSMGSASYIGEGLANPEAFASCAHGAGRAISRAEAKRRIPVQTVIEQLRAKNIALLKVKKSDVAEEAPGAYKDIDAVMAGQRDLVRITVALTPLGVVKG